MLKALPTQNLILPEPRFDFMQMALQLICISAAVPIGTARELPEGESNLVSGAFQLPGHVTARH